MKFSIPILIAIFLGFGLGYFLPSQKSTSVKILTDSSRVVYKDIVKFKTDTFVIEKTKIVKRYDTLTKYVDSSFNYGTDSQKIELFNIAYPVDDTKVLMNITEGQAKSAVKTKNKSVKDSALLYQDSLAFIKYDTALAKMNSFNDKIDVSVDKEVDSAYKDGVKRGAIYSLILLLLIIPAHLAKK
jgi:hypothetical protein